jgi:hypothetical protein
MADLGILEPPREGCLFSRLLEDGRQIDVTSMTFGKGRLCIGPIEGMYDDGWCYASHVQAILAACAWDGEGDDPPFGWHRHIRTGRRRPDGDPEREYVAA